MVSYSPGKCRQLECVGRRLKAIAAKYSISTATTREIFTHISTIVYSDKNALWCDSNL